MVTQDHITTDCLFKDQGDNLTVTLPQHCNDTISDILYQFTPPLWTADLPVALIYCAILVVSLCIGTIGNVIIVVVTATTNTMNKVGKDFVINLALSDLCVNLIAEPMCILGVIKGEEWFSHRWLLCEIVAGMCITACFCAFLSLTLLSVNKYLFVCHNRFYQKISKRSICIAACVTCWVLAFIFEFPNVIGWGGHYFDKKSHQCIWQRTASLSYTMLVSLGFIAFPLALMALCFICIFHKIYNTKKDVFKLNHDDPLRMRRVWTESLRTSRTLAVVFCAFVICWTPYAVITTLDFDDKMPLEAHLFVTMLAHSHSSLNFTIYMTFSKNFRQAVRKLFSCVMFLDSKFKNSTDSTTRSTMENPRSETENDKLKKYYLNPSFQHIEPKCHGQVFSSIECHTTETNNGICRDGSALNGELDCVDKEKY